MIRVFLLLAVALLSLSSHAADPLNEGDKQNPATSWSDRIAPVSQPAGEIADLYGAVKDTAQVAAEAVAMDKHGKALAKQLEKAQHLWNARKGLLKAERTLVTQMTTGSKAARRQAQKQLQNLRKQMSKMPKLPDTKPDLKWANRMESLGKLGDVVSNVEAYRTEGVWGVYKDRTHDMFQAAAATFGGVKGAEAGAVLALGLGLGGPATVVLVTVGTATGTLVFAAGYEYEAKPIIDKNLDEVGGKAAEGLGTAIKAGARSTGTLGEPAQLTPEAEKWAAEEERKAREEAERKREAEAAGERAREKQPEPGDPPKGEPPEDGPRPGPGDGDGDKGDDKGDDKGGDEEPGEDGTGEDGKKDKEEDKDEPDDSATPPETGAEDEPTAERECNPEVPGPCFNQRHNWGEETEPDPNGPAEPEPSTPPLVVSPDEPCNPEVPGPCFNQRHDRSGDADERGLWEGFDSDPGNMDSDRVAANSGRNGSALPENWRPGDTSPQGNQQSAQQGERIGDGYTANPINDAERDQELAEQAERIAAAGNPRGDRGRDRGDSIAGEFGSAPNTDNLPDPNNRPPRQDADDKPGGAKPPTSGSQPPAPKPPAAAPKPPAPKPPAPGNEPGKNDEQPAPPAKPPAGEKPPAPPIPPTAGKPAYDEAYCRGVVTSLQQKMPGMLATVQRIQAAAAAKDEALAHRLSCQYLADSDEVLGSFEAMRKARCPIQGDTSALKSQLARARTQIEQGLTHECGSAPNYTSFAGTWRSAATCPSSGLAGNRWVIDLGQTRDQVSGIIAFHLCPGGGRAEYAVTGKAGSDKSVLLSGRLRSSRGPLAERVQSSMSFTVRKNAPPAPNLAR